MELKGREIYQSLLAQMKEDKEIIWTPELVLMVNQTELLLDIRDLAVANALKDGAARIGGIYLGNGQ